MSALELSALQSTKNLERCEQNSYERGVVVEFGDHQLVLLVFRFFPIFEWRIGTPPIIYRSLTLLTTCRTFPNSINTYTIEDWIYEMEGKLVQVWVPDEKEVWKLADLVSADEEREEVVINDNGLQRTLPSNKIHPLDPTHLEDLDDLCSMNNLHEAPLLSILHRRFAKNLIYTTTGNVLISINPYKTIPGLYDSPLSFLTTAKDFDVASLNEITAPHLYRIANNAFKNISKGTCNQSVIVSGESGAGKNSLHTHADSRIV